MIDYRSEDSREEPGYDWGIYNEMPQVKDNINPNHYKQGNIEVIDFIKDQNFDYLEGNVVKYVSRYKMKNGLEDLKKAQWYLNQLIEEVGTYD